MRVGAAEGFLLPLAARENRHFYAKRQSASPNHVASARTFPLLASALREIKAERRNERLLLDFDFATFWKYFGSRSRVRALERY